MSGANCPAKNAGRLARSAASGRSAARQRPLTVTPSGSDRGKPEGRTGAGWSDKTTGRTGAQAQHSTATLRPLLGDLVGEPYLAVIFMA